VVERSLLALAREAVARVDLTKHRGIHPRVGAIDVIPFVPLRGSSMREAIAAAHRVGLMLATECDVPVFFYGEAAARRDRRELPAVRKGGFEQLGERMCHPGWQPDAGPWVPHPTAGAAVVGARLPLVAFNAVLDTANPEVAKRIARVSREASGGLPAVRALGVFLASRGLAQVTMNLLDYRRTPPCVAAEWVQHEADRERVAVLEYELVGCAPADQFDGWPPHLPVVAGLKPTQLLDPRLFTRVEHA
jgi:glutamate formiminotransferase / 5-formyltetrahydrofolate cyclo-ligase